MRIWLAGINKLGTKKFIGNRLIRTVFGLNRFLCWMKMNMFSIFNSNPSQFVTKYVITIRVHFRFCVSNIVVSFSVAGNESSINLQHSDFWFVILLTNTSSGPNHPNHQRTNGVMYWWVFRFWYLPCGKRIHYAKPLIYTFHGFPYRQCKFYTQIKFLLMHNNENYVLYKTLCM